MTILKHNKLKELKNCENGFLSDLNNFLKLCNGNIEL